MSADMRRAVVWGGVVIAVIALVIAMQAFGTILQDCNFVGLGLGRPSCEANVDGARGTLTIASAALVIGIVAVLAARRGARA